MVNYAQIPMLKLAIAEKKGFLFAANRGGGFGEAVSGLRFSADGAALHVLGESGSLYTLELELPPVNNELSEMLQSWESARKTLSDIARAYLDGIHER